MILGNRSLLHYRQSFSVSKAGKLDILTPCITLPTNVKEPVNDIIEPSDPRTLQTSDLILEPPSQTYPS